MDAIVSAASSASSLKQLAEGKTKTIFAIDGHPGKVLIRSKDSLTAFNAQRKNNIEGKAAVATQTTANVFRYLAKCGIPNHFVVSVDETAFVAEECEMVPIEWVARRVAAGSFLKRHKGVQQGFRFNPPAIESFFKDDAAGDPEWTDEEILSANFVFNGLHIKKPEIALMHRLTDLVFRALEKAWARAECTLVDMKIEFGVTATGRLVLADVVDNDSWRVWPKGQAEQQLDKQFYRDLKEVTKNDLDEVLAKYQRVERLTADFVNVSFTPRVLIVMGSGKDLPFAQKIAEKAADYHLSPVLRVSSAHKTTRETLDLLAEYEDDGVPTVVIAVAGRSNGLGPVLAANSSHLVINCPPPSATAKEDLWSSMSMPSGIGCVTVLSPEEAALAAAKSLSSVNHLIYGRLLGEQIASALAVYEGDREATAAVSQ